MNQKELLKYLKGKKAITNLLLAVLFIICAVVAVAGGIGIIDMGLTGTHKTIALILGVLFAVCGIFSLTDAFSDSALKKQIENLEKQGMLGALMNDFSYGIRFCKDNIIIGNTYILGKETSAITRIDELARVYEYRHTTNKVVDAHSIMAFLKNGSQIELGSIMGIEKTEHQVVDIFNALYARNNNIQFGYK